MALLWRGTFIDCDLDPDDEDSRPKRRCSSLPPRGSLPGGEEADSDQFRGERTYVGTLALRVGLQAEMRPSIAGLQRNILWEGSCPQTVDALPRHQCQATPSSLPPTPPMTVTSEREYRLGSCFHLINHTTQSLGDFTADSLNSMASDDCSEAPVPSQMGEASNDFSEALRHSGQRWQSATCDSLLSIPEWGTMDKLPVIADCAQPREAPGAALAGKAALAGHWSQGVMPPLQDDSDEESEACRTPLSVEEECEAAPEAPADAPDAGSRVRVASGHGLTTISLDVGDETCGQDILDLEAALRSCAWSQAVLVVFVVLADGPRGRPRGQEARSVRLPEAHFEALSAAVAELPVPVLGLALGPAPLAGTSVLMSCDQAIVTSGATLAVLASAREGVRHLGAEQALESGMVGRVVPDAAGLDQACERTWRGLCECARGGQQDAPARMKMAMRSTREFLLQAPGVEEPASPPPPPAKAQPEEQPRKEPIQDPKDMEPTKSLMLCNLPCRMKKEQLQAIIDSLGFAGLYEEVHLPERRTQKARHPSANMGYGFVDFRSEEVAAEFVDKFHGYQFNSAGSSKVASVRRARGASQALGEDLECRAVQGRPHGFV